MDQLEQLRHRLSDRRISLVASECGVHRRTLWRFMSGGGISVKTYRALVSYFNRRQEEEQRVAS